MKIPKSARALTEFAVQLAKDCQSTQNQRAAAYRQYGQIAETGRAAGGLALANLIYSHLDRLAAHLFSPSELRFAIDYENLYPKDFLDKGAVAARVVSREWERKNIDMLFGHGVKHSLTYASCLLKQLAGRDADGKPEFRGARLVMPWQFGVYDEGVNELADQEAFVETTWMNRHEVWRRVRNLPDAEGLYKRVLGNAKKEDGVGVPSSFMHQVLSTSILNTGGVQNGQPQPGGIVQLGGNDPNFSNLSPQTAVQLYPMQELWVRDDDRDDYTTIQFIEPDILIAPLFKHTNLFAPHVQPYTLIQANYEPGYFWGRSEIVDLMMLQSWLTEHLDDARRLMGLQIEGVYAFPGFEGVVDEVLSGLRSSGAIGLPPNTDVENLTPAIPQQLIPMIGEIMQLMDKVSGFPPIMAGQGEPGVRAGVHADTLVKTGSPRLRDRSLLVERQCASAADATLSLLEAKEAKAFWTDPDKGETDFLLSQLPDDRRIMVDSHSASPIYHDDNMNLLAFGLKAGVVTGESFLEQAPFAHRDILIRRLKEKEANELKMALEHPELLDPSRKKRQAMLGHAAEAGMPNGEAKH